MPIFISKYNSILFGDSVFIWRSDNYFIDSPRIRTSILQRSARYTFWINICSGLSNAWAIILVRGTVQTGAVGESFVSSAHSFTTESSGLQHPWYSHTEQIS